MTATVGDARYEIEFRHGTVDVPAGDHAEEREATTCNIRLVGEAKHREEWPIIARGSVVRHFRDVPNKEAARKAALLKAVYEKWPKFTPLFADDTVAIEKIKAMRAARKALLSAYFNRKKGAGKRVGIATHL